ncbi:MAG: DUF4382 domain-containing protein [Thaumarchaeota archaeon]|nr:DUF4382 domain-containing protein [Nitrososphaerota archaeon]MDG6983740.1 DUF4382 domain-containing protein [Nitrososphaerota archaeon]
MKKTYVASVAIAVALVMVLAAAVALTNPSQAKSGTLAIMGTDPAVASSGVSDATVAYSSVYAHQSGQDMASGWTQVSGSGTMDLMASQGTAQTLATSQVSAASYDAFRFNVDSCKVVYQGQTYAATVASSTLTAQSQSKVNVNASSSAAALVDLRTFIENTATTSSPQFVFSATAVATTVPPQTTASLALQVGATLDLSSQAWWSTFMSQTSTNLNVQAIISGNTMSLTLQNAGSADAQVQEIIVTPVSGTAFLSASLPASLSGSAVFTVTSSGAVQQASSLQASALLNGGATVSSGSSANLDYTGSAITGAQLTGILTGEQYVVTCIGANTYASTTVVAS